MPQLVIGQIATLLVTVGVPQVLATGLATLATYGAACKGASSISLEPGR